MLTYPSVLSVSKELLKRLRWQVSPPTQAHTYTCTHTGRLLSGVAFNSIARNKIKKKKQLKKGGKIATIAEKLRRKFQRRLLTNKSAAAAVSKVGVTGGGGKYGGGGDTTYCQQWICHTRQDIKA